MDKWADIEAITDNQREYSKAIQEASKYLACFDTDNGRLVLEELITKFLTKPIVRPNEDAYMQGIREGRADVVRQILFQIEFAKNPKEPSNGILNYYLNKLKGYLWTKQP